MNPSGLARMRVVGKALAGLDPKTHNAMVAALSKRAAPYERWGPKLSPYPDVVRARIDALQTGDLVLCSSGAGKWVGNAIQVLGIILILLLVFGIHRIAPPPAHPSVRYTFIPKFAIMSPKAATWWLAHCSVTESNLMVDVTMGKSRLPMKAW